MVGAAGEIPTAAFATVTIRDKRPAKLARTQLGASLLSVRTVSDILP